MRYKKSSSDFKTITTLMHKSVLKNFAQTLDKRIAFWVSGWMSFIDTLLLKEEQKIPHIFRHGISLPKYKCWYYMTEKCVGGILH